jgi:hypothetical protein
MRQTVCISDFVSNMHIWQFTLSAPLPQVAHKYGLKCIFACAPENFQTRPYLVIRLPVANSVKLSIQP